MAVTSIASGDGTGYEARVSSAGRLQVNTCHPHTFFRSIVTVIAFPTVTNLVSARAGRCSLTVQNQSGVPLAVRFEAGDPGTGDFQVAAGGTFTLPGAYAGEVRATGVGGSVNAVVLEGVA
jgi:hypothetical protein